MTREEIVTKLKEILKQQKSEIQVDDIKDDTKMYEDLKIDSLDLVEVVMGVEMEFKFNIDESKIADLKTFGEIVDFIEKEVNSKEA